MSTEYKLSYTAKEIDEKLGNIVPVDATLTQEGHAADAYTTGARLITLEQLNGIAVIEPAEDDIPKVFFGAPLPQTKDDTIMSFRYISKTKDFSGFCKTKAQGNSSMSYPKKNQTVKLYKDAACTEKLKVGFKGWGKQNKFCFKANWIDLTHARNIVSARLWGDVVKSRVNYEQIPELLRTSPNNGAVDGFPVKVYADGIYQGRYTLNIPKDAWMANMDDELDAHCILCGENYVSGCFRAEAKIDESDWTDEVHTTVPASIKNRWNEAIRFVMDSTDDQFVRGIGNYFDVDSLIDYYIFGLVTCNNDGFGKNQLYMTYDGMKWYATVYDVDNTFGTYLGYMMSHEFPRERYEDYYASYETRYGNLLYIRLVDLFIDAIKVRYSKLKKGALSTANIINRFERFTDITPPALVAEDYAETTASGAFSEIPLKNDSNIQQIRKFITARYPYIDDYIATLGEELPLLYRLPEAVTLTGASGQKIDTGIRLFDQPRSFTIIADISSPAESAKASRIFACEDNGTAENGWTYGGGLSAKIYPWSDTTGIQITGLPENGAENLFEIFHTVNRTKFAVVYREGVPVNAYFLGANESITIREPAKVNVITHNAPFVIGSNNGGGERYNGTIYTLEIYEKAMSAAEVSEKLTAMGS